MTATTNPPAYSFARSPSYSAEPHAHEQRLAMVDQIRPLTRPMGNFVKLSKNGDVRLILRAQECHATPVYGSRSTIEGAVELSRPEGITSVEIKVEGRLRYKEIAEGGTTSTKLDLGAAFLWVGNLDNTACPSTLHFSVPLPPTYTYDEKTYPLPPTFSVKLSGLPGFVATIDYSVSAIINKPHSVPPLVPLVKSHLLGIHIGSTVVTLPFTYHPRARPAIPLPPRLTPSRGGFNPSPEWRLYTSKIDSKSGSYEIVTKLYVPASRVFCSSLSIPFHITFESSASVLAAFLPLSPAPGQVRPTRLEVMRQSTLDVRLDRNGGGKTSIWRVDRIGSGFFRHAGDGPTWVSYSGEIDIDESVQVGGFRASGLSVKDFILLTVTPPDPHRSQFLDMRQAIPVRLTSDAWVADGAGICSERDSYYGYMSVEPSVEA